LGQVTTGLVDDSDIVTMFQHRIYKTIIQPNSSGATQLKTWGGLCENVFSSTATFCSPNWCVGPRRGYTWSERPVDLDEVWWSKVRKSILHGPKWLRHSQCALCASDQQVSRKQRLGLDVKVSLGKPPLHGSPARLC